MNGLERFMAALAGENADLAVGMAYPEIPLRDRCEEHTDLPWWTMDEADPDVCVPMVRHYLELVGSDWWPVCWTAPRDQRARQQYRRQDGRDFVVDTTTGQEREIFRPGHEPPGRSTPTPARPTLSEDAWVQRVRTVPARQQIDSGQWDCAAAMVRGLGNQYFLYSYTNTPFVLSFAKGFEDTMVDVATNPVFLHRMAERLVAQQTENFRAMSELGIPGVWMQDFSAGTELISRAQYADFVWPHGRDLVAEAHRQGLVVLHYYMGDPRDRVDLVAGMGADVLLFEESRKGYPVDLDTLTAQLPPDGPVVMGNLSAERALAGDGQYDLAESVRRLVQFGRRRGRFVFGTGAPPTPETPLARVRLALTMARRFWDLLTSARGPEQA